MRQTPIAPPTDPRMLKLFTHIYLQPISVTSIMASVDGPSLTLTKCNGRDTVVLPGVAALDHQVTTLGQKQVGQSGNYMCGSRGGAGVPTPPPPLKNYKNIGFLSNTGRDPLKNHKATKPIPRWAIIGPPAKRHLNGVSLACR